MNLSEKSKQHVDSCRFCWMCHHVCPIGNATGHERSTPRARALGISLVNRDAMELGEIMDNIYECAGCGGCVQVCVTGWDPVMFTREVRLQAALEGKLPPYIQKMVDRCLETGNAYGRKPGSEDDGLKQAISRHSGNADTLFYLGADARYRVPDQAVRAIGVLEKAGVDFRVAQEEPTSGAHLDFLIGDAQETREQMKQCAAFLNLYQTVVIYDPADAKVIRQTFHHHGIELTCRAVTYTMFLSELLSKGRLKGINGKKQAVVYQDPFQLSRDLGETEEPRRVISAFAELREMLLNREETVWAGNLLMAEYLPDVIRLVAARRIFNAASVGAKIIVTTCPGEYAALRSVEQDQVEILSLEDLIPE